MGRYSLQGPLPLKQPTQVSSHCRWSSEDLPKLTLCVSSLVCCFSGPRLGNRSCGQGSSSLTSLLLFFSERRMPPTMTSFSADPADDQPESYWHAMPTPIRPRLSRASPLHPSVAVAIAARSSGCIASMSNIRLLSRAHPMRSVALPLPPPPPRKNFPGRCHCEVSIKQTLGAKSAMLISQTKKDALAAEESRPLLFLLA
ncbi:hypothetical protein EDB81DRAFT_409195 [Dactylonectria macrodidyma]|uniref:Uncharacterized protein n=1 Tax=Dactylonectria macrodidyma TaxID=307937 RepID=A0A9P9FAQ4_9HYPO|nr:hypothetical protein EDB81DRAFT_409195 [Dactylonectria macrodidyma]